MSYQQMKESEIENQQVVVEMKKTKQKSNQYKKAKQKVISKGEFDPDWIASGSQEDQDTLYRRAEEHQDACRVGYRDPTQDDNDISLCECCGKQLDKKQLDLTCQTIDLDFLGPGYPLFFDYIKYCCFFLIIIILSAGSYSYFSNQEGTGCESHKKCISGWVINSSFINKTGRIFYLQFLLASDQKLLELQDILNIFTIFAIIMLLQIFRHQQMIVNQQCDNGEVSAGDYAIMCQYIPKDLPSNYKSYKQFIKDQIEQTYSNKSTHAPGEQITVSDINIAYNLTDLNILLTTKAAKVQELQSRLTVFYNSGTWPTEGYTEASEKELRDKIAKIEEETDAHERTLAKAHQAEVKKYFTGIAFVSFQTEQMKARVVEENSPSFFEKYILRKVHIPLSMDNQLENGTVGKQSVKVTQAPEPTDIIWSNLHATDGDLRKRSIFGSCLVFLLLFLCFALIYAMAKEQRIYQDRLTVLEKQLKKDTNETEASTSDQSLRFLMENRQFALEERYFEKRFLMAHNFYTTHHLDGETADNSTQAANPAPADEETTPPAPTTPNAEDIAQQESQLQAEQSQSVKTIKFIALMIGMVIAFLNKFLIKVMGIITNLELPFTKTAIQTFLIKVIIPWSISGFKSAQQALITPSGLVYNENMVILQNVVTTNALNLIDLAMLFKWPGKFFAGRKKGKQTATQQQMNTIYEYPEFTMPENYAFIINSMLLTAFYSPLLPIALFYTLICLFLAYWIYKYQLLRKRTVKSALGVQLSQSMTDQLELFLPVFCFGNLIFNTMLANPQATEDFGESKFDFFLVWFKMFLYSSYYQKIGILVGIVHYFAPTQTINSILMPLSEDIQNPFTYEESRRKIFSSNNYETENPVTREEAMLQVNQSQAQRKSLVDDRQ